MNKLAKLLLISILSLAPLYSEAATLTDATIKNNISKIIIEQYKKYTDATIELDLINLPFKSVEVPEGKVTYKVNSNFDKFVKRDIKKVQILVNGKVASNFIVSTNARAYKNVLVATSYIDRDSIISSNNVSSQRMEISANLDYILTTEMLKRELVAKKWFREGEILDKRFVRIKPDIERNTEVKAYVNSNNILIQISATALEEGRLGDYISLENKKYGKKYRGKVIGENKVLINM